MLVSISPNIKVPFPSSPEIGEEFHYICPISGCADVAVRWDGKYWQIVKWR